jgi:hypothetical protein
MAQSDPDLYNYSPVVTATSSGAFGIGSDLSWIGYQREIYKQINAALTKQADILRQRGNITAAEAKALVEQRNAIVLETRSKLSPFGRLFSEIEKPAASLRNFEQLLAEKGSIEAVVQSVGKTRAAVNRLSVVLKAAGDGAVVIEVVVSVVIIAIAPPEQRARVASGQTGRVVGSAGFGWAGAWAGCATAAALASPTLVIPIAGEGADGTACIVGGILGGFGLGILGGSVGERAGSELYDYVTTVRWTKS